MSRKRTVKKTNKKAGETLSRALEKKDIIKALETIKPGIAGCNDLSEQSELVIFAKDRIFSFNDNISISYPLDTGLEGSIYANEFLKFVRKAPEKEIEISLDENQNQFIFKSGNVRAGFYIKIVDPPKLDAGENWDELPPNFSDALLFCYPTTETGSYTSALGSVQIIDGLVISCNNYQASKYQLTDCPVSGLIPSDSAKILSSFNPVAYQKGSGRLDHYKSEDGAIMSILSAEDDYPTDKVLGLFEAEGEPIELPENLKDVLERQEVMAFNEDNSTPVITINITENTMEFNAKNIKGWISETVTTSKNEKEFSFMINPITLKRVLGEIHDITVNESMLNIKSDIFSYAIALCK